MEIARKYRIILSLIFNVVIIYLVICGTIFCQREMGIYALLYYTEQSNFILGIVAVIYCVFSIRELKYGLPVPKFIFVLKYVSVCLTTMTLLINLAIITPSMGRYYYKMVFFGSVLFFHTLCPLLSLVSFLLIEPKYTLKFGNSVFALFPTLLYGTVLVYLNYKKITIGPYFFFRLYYNGVLSTVYYFLLVVLCAYLISCVILILSNRIKTNQRLY